MAPDAVTLRPDFQLNFTTQEATGVAINLTACVNPLCDVTKLCCTGKCMRQSIACSCAFSLGRVPQTRINQEPKPHQTPALRLPPSLQSNVPHQQHTVATHCGNTPTHDCTQRRQHYPNATKVAYQPALAFPPPNHRAPRCACTGCHLASANGRPSDGTWPFHAFMRDAAPTDSVAAMPRGPCQQLQQGRGHHGCCWNHAITYASSGQRIQAGSTQSELEVHTHTPPVHGVVAMHECILVS